MKHKRVHRTKIALLAACAACAVVPAAAQGQAQRGRISYDIPSQDLGTALTQLARQSNREIYFSADLTRGKRGPRLSGAMTFEKAIARLLEGSGLTYRADAGGSITIERLGAAGNVASQDGDYDEERGRSDILVTGSHSRNADIHRTEDDAQPYVVFGKEDIVASQATTVEEFLRTRMPMNSAPEGSLSQSTGNGLIYSRFDLRGLGTNQTLILVNGRRLPIMANQNLTPRQADINGIPMGAIERIEILPSSAGGIYGGNAVGGVINIILKSDYRGLDITATYNDTFDFHAPNGRLDVNGGFALEGGRTTVTFSGSVSRSGTLKVGDRVDLIKDGIDLYRRNVNIYAGTGLPPIGNGVNIRSTTGAVLTLDPQYGGASLGSSFTTLPLGYAGVASDNGAALLANAGTFNLDMPSDLSGVRRGILSSPKIASGNISVRRKFSELFDLFVDYSHLENEGLSYSANTTPNSISTLAANAPNNPFQQAVRITFPVPDASFPYRSKSITNVLSVGTIVRLPFKWAVNIEYNKTWTTNGARFFQRAISDAANTCLTSGAASCNGGPALNPFQAPIDYSPYFYTEPTYVGGPYKSQFNNPTFRASGPLFKLPGGHANLTLAVQRESTILDDAVNAISDGTATGKFYAIFPGRKQSTTSEYGELTLPLVSPSNDIPFLRELELRGAVRHDSYYTAAPPGGTSYIDYPLGSTLYTQMGGFESIYSGNPDVQIPAYDRVESRFGSTNFTLAGRYSPFEGVVFRASYASGFLPPSVVQVATTVTPGLQATLDPFRGNTAELYPIDVIYAGNPNLRPETSRTLSAGVILTPTKGLRFSADYTRIQKRDELVSPASDYVVANPDLFPGRVVRAARDPSDPTGWLGKIISIDTSLTNMLRSQVQAIDFQLDYSWKLDRFGEFRTYALASWQPETIRQLLPQAPALNYSGNRDGPLTWQGNGGFDWTWNGLAVRWNTQFYNHYNIYSTQNLDLASGRSVVAAAITQQGSTRIPRQAYSDLFISYDFGDAKGVFNGMRITAGIQNIFDTKPPVIAISSYTPAGDSPYGDPRLRRFSLSLKKSFGTR